MSNKSIAIKTVYFSIIGNTLLATVKWLTGYFGNSYALIADAIESTADIFSSVLVLAGIKFSTKPADKKHPYGHGKVEPLVTFIVVGFLITAAIIIGYESIQNIQTPHELPEYYTLIILGAIILWKEGSYRYVSSKSKKTGSSSLKADAWHHRSDAITSVAAFIGITVALIMGKGYETADDWAALLAAGVILFNSWLIFRPALGEILDEQQYGELISKIKTISLDFQGIKDTEKCYVRKLGMSFYVDLHVQVDHAISVKESHQIAHNLKNKLISQINGIEDVLIHIEPYENKND